MKRIVEEFYGQPERAVPLLNTAFALSVGWLSGSPWPALGTWLAGRAAWSYWSGRLVIDDLSQGHITLSCPGHDQLGSPLVWLTFDDGPGEHTREIVALLNHAQTPATFFFVGSALQKYEHTELLAQELRRGGHTVANHTFHHPNLLRLSPQQRRTELRDNQRLLEYHFGDLVRPLFRPPFGYRDAPLLELSEELALETVGWSLNSLDFLSGLPERITERVCTRFKAGAILLFHDGGGDRSRTVAALPEILSQLELGGFGAYSPS